LRESNRAVMLIVVADESADESDHNVGESRGIVRNEEMESRPRVKAAAAAARTVEVTREARTGDIPRMWIPTSQMFRTVRGC